MECSHVWELIYEEDCGEMDYSSYGGPTEHYIVSLYRCCLCGALKKEGHGDFNGDPAELLEITDEDRYLAEKD